MEMTEVAEKRKKEGKTRTSDGAPKEPSSLTVKSSRSSSDDRHDRFTDRSCSPWSIKRRFQTKKCKIIIVGFVVGILLFLCLTLALVVGTGNTLALLPPNSAVTDYEDLNGTIDFVCPPRMSRCGNLTRCVAQKNQCDKVDDCGNNADEEKCELDEGWIRKFDEVVIVTLQPGREMSKECGLYGFPEVCECYDTTKLICFNTSLTQVPQGISTNITHLNLRESMIRNLEDGAFERYTQLGYLNLFGNGIRKLNRDVFQSLTNLRSLYLPSNRISSFTPGTFRHLHNLIWLFLNDNDIDALDAGIFEGLGELYWLMLQNNRISHLKQSVAFSDLPKLSWMDISGNPLNHVSPDNFTFLVGNITLLIMSRCNITTIHKDTFQQFPQLTSLQLSENPIEHFPSELFRNLSQLKNLNISYCPATELPEDLFDSLTALDALLMEGMDINNISARMFSRMEKLQHISFSKFKYCRYASRVRTCKPQSDGISSFENLLKDGILRVSVWTIGLLCFVGNAGVLVSRFLMKAENRIHSLVVINLCTADFCMSIYLFIIGYHDALFRNNFNAHALAWMQSSTCTFAGFLGMLSSEVSVLMLTFISLERFICIAYPYRLHRLTSKEAIVIMTFIWFMGAFISWIPLIGVDYFENFYGSNGVCFPLHIHDPWQSGWEYSSFVFLGINASCFAAIAVSYTGMFISIQQTRKASSQAGRRGDLNYAKRFFFVVLTDALCWLPIAVLKILSLCNFKIPATLYGWIVIFVLPINSALNPMLYTLSTTSFSQWFHRHIKRRKSKSCKSNLGSKNDSSTTRGRIGSATEQSTEYCTILKRPYDSDSSPVEEEKQCVSL